MPYIERMEVESQVAYKELDVSKVTIFPESGRVEYETYFRYYDSNGKLVKTTTEGAGNFKADVSKFVDLLRDRIKKDRRPGR